MASESKKLVASKPCVVDGCNGTMFFHERLNAPDAPHTLEFPWYASWRCGKDSTHWQLISRDEEDELRGKSRSDIDPLPFRDNRT